MAERSPSEWNANLLEFIECRVKKGCPTNLRMTPPADDGHTGQIRPRANPLHRYSSSETVISPRPRFPGAVRSLPFLVWRAVCAIEFGEEEKRVNTDDKRVFLPHEWLKSGHERVRRFRPIA
jgi:hypothetical protein